MLIHYIEFLTPGTLFPESVIRQIESRNPSEIPVDTIPDGTYVIQFFDREEIIKDGENLVGRNKNHSVIIMFGLRYTLKGLERLRHSEDNIYRNLKRSDAKHAVKCIPGNWQLEYEDTVILEKYSDLAKLNKEV